MIEQANLSAQQIVDEAREQAKVEANRISEQSQANLQQQIASARSELRQEVAALAVKGAESILRSEVDEQKHSDMLKSLSSSL